MNIHAHVNVHTNTHSHTQSRWLRARKYDLQNTIAMVEEAKQCTSAARRHSFYPSPSTALGCDSSLYIQQYPQVYYGHAKNGCPIFYSKPAKIEINAIEALTSLQGIINFHWHDMRHEFVHKLQDQYTKSNGSFKRYECVCVLDLKNLTAAQLSKRPMKIIKEQSAIDSLCFPETLNHMAIVNSPTFFTFTWKVIKSWIDPRTANKVSVIGSGKEYLSKHLGKIVERGQLPSDYGGDGPSIDEILQDDMVRQYNESAGASTSGSTSTDTNGNTNTNTNGLKVKRKNTYLISLRGKSSCQSITIEEGSTVKAMVSTRSVDGATLSIRDEKGKSLSLSTSGRGAGVGGITIKHTGAEDNENELPTTYDLEEDYGIILEEPGQYVFHFESLTTGRHQTSYFVLATSEFTKDTKDKDTDDNTNVNITKKMRDPSQAGNDKSNDNSSDSVLLSSQSLCTGMCTDNLEDVLLVRPTPKTRKDKKIFISTTKGVNAMYQNQNKTLLEPNVKRCSMSTTSSESPLSQMSPGCGAFST